jgi:hypothetical protein
MFNNNSIIEDFLTDSEIDTETEYDNLSDYDRATTADFDEILMETYRFTLPQFESKFKFVESIMPDVDLNVCPIQELKLFEFCSLFAEEMAEHSMTEQDIMDMIVGFSDEDLASL